MWIIREQKRAILWQICLFSLPKRAIWWLNEVIFEKRRTYQYKIHQLSVIKAFLKRQNVHFLNKIDAKRSFLAFFPGKSYTFAFAFPVPLPQSLKLLFTYPIFFCKALFIVRECLLQIKSHTDKQLLSLKIQAIQLNCCVLLLKCRIPFNRAKLYHLSYCHFNNIIITSDNFLLLLAIYL